MEKTIQVTHVNVRTSISLLLAKLLFIEIMSGGLAILSFSSLSVIRDTFSGFEFTEFTIPIFASFLLLKMALSIYIVLQWLNEYYEITPSTLYHRKGVFFKKEEKFLLNHVRMVEIYQSAYGRMFNFGTVSLSDFRGTKYQDMYMIHNPLRYSIIIEELIPTSDGKKKTLAGSKVYKNFDD